MGVWNCAVPCCRNRRKKGGKILNWHAFPKDKSIRKAWIIKIKRDEGHEFKITANTKVCSEHFMASDYTARLHGKLKLLKKNAVPSVFNWTDTTKADRSQIRQNRLSSRNKNKVADLNVANVDSDGKTSDIETPNTPIDTQYSNEDSSPVMTDFEEECKQLRKKIEDLQRQECTQMEAGVQELKKQNEKLEKENRSLEIQIEKWKGRALSYKNIKNSPKLVNFYTGLPDDSTFQGLIIYFKDKIEKCVYWKGGKTEMNKKYQSDRSNKPGLGSKLSLEDSLFLILLRLKLAPPIVDLARTFDLSTATASRLFTTWITLMYHEFKTLFKIPPLEVIKKATPPQFKEYPDTTIIIDCTEIKVQKAFALHTQRETFSNYKHNNTVKALIGITPGGLICFVSPLYGGSASDKHIVKDSGFLQLMTPGHCIMADKGFEIESMLPPGVTLNVPPKFMKKKTIQMPENDVLTTRKIAKVRVHVERAIRRIKTYHILDHALPLTLIDVSEQIVAVCSFLTNFKPTLIKHKNE